MKNYGRSHEIISIWDAKDIVNIDNTRKKYTELPTEHIFIYHKNKLNKDNTQNLLKQFNLDFDRQKLSLNKVKCSSRFHFFKSITPYLSHSTQLDHIMLLCQQTVFAYIFKDLLALFKMNRLDHLIADSTECVDINIVEIPGKRDIQIDIKKKLLVLDAADPDLILNTINIEIISESLFDPLIYIYVNFQFKM